MVQLSKVPDVGLFNVTHLLDSDRFLVEFAKEDRTLSAAAEPLQVRDVLEWNLPVVYKLSAKTFNLIMEADLESLFKFL